MDPNIFTLLEFLAGKGVNKSVDISAELNGIYTKGERLLDATDVVDFMTALNQYVDFEGDDPYPSRGQYGFFKFKAHVTNDGINALKYERDRIRHRQVDESVMSTNKSVERANDALIANANAQTVINQQLANNSIEQTSVFRTQTNIFRATLGLTILNILIGGGILWHTITSNTDKLTIGKQDAVIADQNKEIKRLRLLKSDTIHYVLHYPVPKSKIKVK